MYGDKDTDGFYRGHLRGRTGLLPCNMVSEIRAEDEETLEQLLQQGFLPLSTPVDRIGTASGLFVRGVSFHTHTHTPGHLGISELLFQSVKYSPKLGLTFHHAFIYFRLVCHRFQSRVGGACGGTRRPGGWWRCMTTTQERAPPTWMWRYCTWTHTRAHTHTQGQCLPMISVT